MKPIIIAIDGYAACGKSSTARAVAQALGYIYIDSGAMYRAFTLFMLRNGALPNINFAQVDTLLSQTHLTFALHPQDASCIVKLNGEEVNREIRSLEVGAWVSEVSAIKEVRAFMVARQQELGKDKGVVMDGRDIGTVVFPEAELKVFMIASIEKRVSRRMEELIAQGRNVSKIEVEQDLQKRDHLDTTRKESPLRQATDARVLDTTNLSFDEQVAQVINWAREIMTQKELFSS